MRMGVGRMLVMGALLASALGGCGKPAAAPASASGPAEPAPAAASTPLVEPAASAASVVAADSGLPDDVVSFRTQREACDHFRGEDPFDAKRAEFLAKAVAKACTGTDKALAALRQRHASDARALAALKDYDDKIE